MNIETHARLLAAEVRRMHNLEREMLISKARITTLSAEITTMLDFTDRAAQADVLPAVREPGQDLRLIHSRPYVIPGGAASLAAGNRERGRGQTFAFNPIHKRLENETDTDVLPVVKMLCSLGRSDCPESGEHLHRPDGTVAYAAETP